MKINLGIMTLLLIGMVIFSGCKADQQNGETGPTSDTAISYPVTTKDVPTQTPAGYPAPDSELPPSTAPVRPNASLMNVEVLSIIPNEKNTEDVILHVKVNSSAPTNGMDEYNSNLVGTEIDIHLAAADAAILAVGTIFNLTVSYRGDEWGGGYYGSNPTFDV